MGHSWLGGLIFFGVFLGAVMGPQMYLEQRRGGAGPRYGYIPPAMRERVNQRAREMDWPVPFDEDGEKVPLKERRRRARIPEPWWAARLRLFGMIVIFGWVIVGSAVKLMQNRF